MMRLQMPVGTDSVTHGGTGYVVNNVTWQVTVDDECGKTLLATGSGAVLIVDDFDPATDVRCPHCDFVVHDVIRKETA